MSIIYGLKVNLSVAMVAMLNHTAIRESTNHTNELKVNWNITQTSSGDDSCQESSSTAAVEVNNLLILTVPLCDAIHSFIEWTFYLVRATTRYNIELLFLGISGEPIARSTNC